MGSSHSHVVNYQQYTPKTCGVDYKTNCILIDDKIVTQKPADDTVALQDLNADGGIDWRTKGAVPPVRNQGACGSSEIFAAVNMVESAHFIASGKMENLSI